ncbi:MAG: aminodeoxychorismate/anthranilate synthase component II [Pseudomonadota bacterium]
MLTLIDNYDSFTWNLVHFIGDFGVKCRVYRNDEKSVTAVLAEKPSAIVLSPGPCTPDEAGICLDLVTRAKGKVPIFGVCLGYQSIGQAYGGRIVRAPTLMHGKRSNITHNGLGLFDEIRSPIRVTRYHSLMLDQKSLPDALEATAKTDDGLLMAVSHKRHPVHGVLFHPESVASEAGHAIIANFLDMAGIRRHAHTPEITRPAQVA